MTVQAGVQQLFLGDIRTSAFGTLCDMACLLGNPSVTAAFSVAMKVWNLFISTSTEPSPGDLIQRFVVDHLFLFLLVHHDPSGYSALFFCQYYTIGFAVKQTRMRSQSDFMSKMAKSPAVRTLYQKWHKVPCCMRSNRCRGPGQRRRCGCPFLQSGGIISLLF